MVKSEMRNGQDNFESKENSYNHSLAGPQTCDLSMMFIQDQYLSLMRFLIQACVISGQISMPNDFMWNYENVDVIESPCVCSR